MSGACQPELNRHLAYIAAHLQQAAAEESAGNRAVLVELARRRWERCLRLVAEEP